MNLYSISYTFPRSNLLQSQSINFTFSWTEGDLVRRVWREGQESRNHGVGHIDPVKYEG